MVQVYLLAMIAREQMPRLTTVPRRPFQTRLSKFCFSGNFSVIDSCGEREHENKILESNICGEKIASNRKE